MSAWRVLVILAIAGGAGACTRNPDISVRRLTPDRFEVAVVRCAPDAQAARALEDVEAVAARRCRHGHTIDAAAPERSWLGNAFLGECPAIRVRATVVCKGVTP